MTKHVLLVKLAGCHSVQKHKTAEKWPVHKPIYKNDLQGCFCYDYHGAKCALSCVKDVTHHEIRQQFGHYRITVTCSPGNYVLGCGMKPRYYSEIHDFDKWRGWQVHNSTTCQCYDSHGATCYAVCGKFDRP